MIAAEPNTNVMCGKTVIPAMRYGIAVGTTTIVTKVYDGRQ